MQTDLSNIPNKLGLRYSFTDDSHTMDAIIRNSCERELLAIVNEIASLLEVDINIETEAYIKDGLNEVWTLISENRYATGVITGILINILSGYLTQDSGLPDLQNEELRLEIDKLKRGLKESKGNRPNINPEDSITAFNSNIKITKHRSKFYQNLIEYAKVSKITTVLLSHGNLPIIDPVVVEGKEFDRFVLKTDELELVMDESATIEIISPVLKNEKYNWKGIYKGEVIHFSLRDKEFRHHVTNNDIQFKNGTCIDCILKISRKISNLGEIQNSGYTVLTVLRKHDDGTTTETPQGKRYRIKNEMETKQLKLFKD